MKIIDFHAHIYPEKIAEKAVENVGAFYNLKMQGNGTSENLIKTGSSTGIGAYVVHSPALQPKNVPVINQFIAQQCTLHSELIGFGTLHAGLEDYEGEIQEIMRLGLQGIKIHPDSQGFDLDDPRMMPMYEMIEDAGLPVLFHTGDYRYDFSHPRRLRHVMEVFPNLTCIAAHFGGWSIFDLAVEYLLDTDCYLDISSSMSFLGPRRTKELISLYGTHRMLFGSDFPMWSPADELKQYLALGFAEADNRKILYENGCRILQKTI